MKKNTNSNVNDRDDEQEETLLSRDSVRDAIFDIAVDMFTLSEDDRDGFEDMELEYDAKCDMIDIVEFVMSLEDEFGVIISEDEADKIVTFEDCIDLVWSKVMSENIQMQEKDE